MSLVQAPPARRSAPTWSSPLLVAVAAGAVVGCLLVRDPNEPGAYPLCPFRALTGWDCPGCGSLRAMRDLAGGDVAGAVDHNLLLVIAVPLLAWRWLTWSRARLRGEPPGGWAVPAPLILGLLVVTLTFWVVRNLPGVPLLGSGIG